MSCLQVSQLVDSRGMPLGSLRDVNRLPVKDKEKIYARLIPDVVFSGYDIDPETFCGKTDGFHKVAFICPGGIGVLKIEVRLQPDHEDCLFFVELADTQYRQLELSLVLANDPFSPRYTIDHDSEGRDNFFGSCRRNVAEEIKAMNAGLAPNQVRKGKKLFRPFLTGLEEFAASLGLDMIVAEALSYSNAIKYETYGFDYIIGKARMKWIDREFRPGGVLYQRLDGSTPFRMPGMEETVRGRSWAIHDGILDEPWDEVRIYKNLGEDAGIDTFPDKRF